MTRTHPHPGVSDDSSTGTDRSEQTEADFDYAELLARVETGEFQRTCADIVLRQNAGEDFTPQQLSEMMGLPIWYVDHQIRMARLRLMDGYVEPPTRAVH